MVASGGSEITFTDPLVAGVAPFFGCAAIDAGALGAAEDGEGDELTGAVTASGAFSATCCGDEIGSGFAGELPLGCDAAGGWTDGPAGAGVVATAVGVAVMVAFVEVAVGVDVVSVAATGAGLDEDGVTGIENEVARACNQRSFSVGQMRCPA